MATFPEHEFLSQYSRPHIEPVEFRDGAGNVIDYGNRWESLGWEAPEDSYSVVEHPERFEPLHRVAKALIDYFVAAYDVDVEEGVHLTDGLMPPGGSAGITRAVRLTPRRDGSAPMTFVLTDFPGVRVFAGALFEEVSPSCGCNACDERWDEAAEELEWQTFAVVGGGLTEAVSEPRRAKWSFDLRHGLVKGMGQTVSHHLRSLDGQRDRSGQSDAEDVPIQQLKNAEEVLTAVAAVSGDGNWLPWPERKNR